MPSFLILRFIRPENLAQICARVITETSFQEARGCEAYAVAFVTELSVDGGYQTYAALISGNMIINRRAETVHSLIRRKIRVSLSELLKHLRMAVYRKIFSVTDGHHLNKADVKRPVLSQINQIPYRFLSEIQLYGVDFRSDSRSAGCVDRGKDHIELIKACDFAERVSVRAVEADVHGIQAGFQQCRQMLL